jgi:hypothetical protein
MHLTSKLTYAELVNVTVIKGDVFPVESSSLDYLDYLDHSLQSMFVCFYYY